MSSLAERLRVRSEKRPLYNIDDLDDDEVFSVKEAKAPRKDDKPAGKFSRDNANEDACQACGESGDLISCITCTYSFHSKCLLFPKAASKKDWSCPECVDPLSEVEKILDFKETPMSAEKTDALKPGSNAKNVKHYYVKWKGLAYIHCTWVPEKEFLKAYKIYPRLKIKISNFHKQMESINDCEDEFVAVRPEWTTVDRILTSRNIGDEREYFVKWKDLPYDECSWEVKSDIASFQPEIERYKMILSRGRKKGFRRNKSSNLNIRDPTHRKNEFQHYEQTPDFLSEGKLHPYQLEGLNFLRYSWSKNTHVILADEMGLGKTIQSIAFLASLFEENISPHLVVAPLSTLRNWEREFATWAPQMNVVMYFGSSPARAIVREYEFYFPKEKKIKERKKKGVLVYKKRKQEKKIKFDVLLTSYEMINMDSSILKSIQWESMIVDEGHRLKNKDSKLFLQLQLYSTKHRVLLTGTPLQNNLDELFMLMHFLDAGKFDSLEDFQKEFKDINQQEQIARLHKMLAPHLLRRVKKDVMKDLPPKKELILRVDLTNKQKEYYKAILTRNYNVLARRGGQVSLNNVVMELRKLCSHVYMLEGVEPQEMNTSSDDGLRELLDNSGKMQLLDKMMVRLKEQGHRVLIYSQFHHMLDLLEDYLSCKKWNYERIDGKIGGAERQIRIDRFNAKNSTRFCFLLSTRAGGLGINLATADTVIIYDSDWNPHADLQAMARAHRLGQTNKVMIYRLVTRATIEERMMQMTKKKMILEHIVVGRLKAPQSVNQEELDDIIRYGAKELFADEEDEAGKARQIHYDDAAIDRLLNRDQIVGEETTVDDEDDGFLKAFKVANFEYIDEVEAAAAAEEDEKKDAANNDSVTNSERANYWENLLRNKFEIQQIDEFIEMGKGKRTRKQMAASGDDDANQRDGSSQDEDYCEEDDLSDRETGVPGNAAGRRAHVSRKKIRDYSNPPPLMEGEGRTLKVLGFNQNQRSTFYQLLMRFGFGKYDWKEFVHQIKGKSWQEIHDYGVLFMQHIIEPLQDSMHFTDGVPKEGLKIEDVLVRISTLRSIEDKVQCVSDNPSTPLFSDDISSCFPALCGKIWKGEHDLLLLKAILKHGYARWQNIVEDKDIGLADVVHREANIPSISESVPGSAVDGATSVPSANGTSQDISQGQSCPDISTNFHYREVQRRMVEFLRKRFLLLEKGLNMESYLEKYGNARPCDPVAGDFVSSVNLTNLPTPKPFDGYALLKELPILHPVASELPISDGRTNGADVLCLYNEICRVLDENALDSVEAYLGDTAARYRLGKSFDQLEKIYSDMGRIFCAPVTTEEHTPAPLVSADTVEKSIDGGSRVEDASTVSKNSILNGNTMPTPSMKNVAGEADTSADG